MTDKTNIAETLQAVRESYYFLHQFQLRLRDTMDRFREQFMSADYCFAMPTETNVPTFRTNPHDKWLVDLFPAYYYSIAFENRREEDRSVLFEVMFQCDQSFEAKEDSFPIEDENSKTSLRVYVFITDEPIKADVKFQTLWKDTFDYPVCYTNDTDIDLRRIDKALKLKAIGVELNFEKMIDEDGIRGEAERVKELVEKKLGYNFGKTTSSDGAS